MTRLNYQEVARDRPVIALLQVAVWTLAVVPFIGRRCGALANSVRQN